MSFLQKASSRSSQRNESCPEARPAVARLADFINPNKIPRLVNQAVLSVHADAPSRVEDLLKFLGTGQKK
jgi:hypothetical protein